MPMPPNVNAIYDEANAIVVATLGEALAKQEWAAQSMPLVEEMAINDTLVNLPFLLDNHGLQPLLHNIEKKAGIKKQIQFVTSEWVDNITVPLRDLTSAHGDMYRMLAQQKGRGVPRWQDQQVAKMLKSTGAAFVTPGFDGVPYFSSAHPMNLAGEDIAVFDNLDSAGGGNYWFLFDASFIKPILLNWKTRPEARDLGPDSEHAKKFFEVMWNLYADAGYGMGPWFYGYASNQALDEAHFNTARIAMQQVPTYGKVDGESQLMGVRPTVLVVGSTNQLAAEKLIKNGTVNGGDPNPLYNAVQVVALAMLP